MHNAVSPLPRAVFRRREPLHTDAHLYELVHDTGTPRVEVGSQSCGSCVRGQLPKQNIRMFTAQAVGGRKYSYACSRVVSHSNNMSLCSYLSASLLLSIQCLFRHAIPRAARHFTSLTKDSSTVSSLRSWHSTVRVLWQAKFSSLNSIQRFKINGALYLLATS